MAHERSGAYPRDRARESLSQDPAARNFTGRRGRGAIAMIRHACLGLLFVGLVHGAAAAQSTSSDPVENATVRVGPFGINPAVVVKDIGVDNNVFNENTNPKSDFTFTLTPRAEVLFHPR